MGVGVKRWFKSLSLDVELSSSQGSKRIWKSSRMVGGGRAWGCSFSRYCDYSVSRLPWYYSSVVSLGA